MIHNLGENPMMRWRGCECLHDVSVVLPPVVDPAKKMWVMTGESATDVLKWIVQVVCQRDLSDYKAAWRTAESAVEIESQWKFSNQSFTKAVADTCRAHLCVHSSDWELDDEGTRHLLNFEGMVLNTARRWSGHPCGLP